MDYVEGRGVTSGNEVYFIFDAENDVVVMAMYRDAPGVRSDLLKPNIVKTFSKDEWGDINEFLSAGANEGEEEAEEAESSPLFQQIVPEGELSESEKELLAAGGSVFHTKRLPGGAVSPTANIAAKDVQLPKMNNVPELVEDDKEEVEEDGKEDE